MDNFISVENAISLQKMTRELFQRGDLSALHCLYLSAGIKDILCLVLPWMETVAVMRLNSSLSAGELQSAREFGIEHTSHLAGK